MTSTEHALSNNQSSNAPNPPTRPNHSRQSSSTSSVSSTNSSKPRRILSPNIPARKTSTTNSSSASPSTSAPGTPQSLPWMNSANKPTAAGIAQALQERARQLREKEQLELAKLQAGNGEDSNGGNSSNDDSMDSSITATPNHFQESGTNGIASGNADGNGLTPSSSGRDSVSKLSENTSEASTPRANPSDLPKSNPTSPTTPLPSSPLKPAQDDSNKINIKDRPISTASTISKYSATGWDDYNGVVQAMDWGEEGAGGDQRGSIDGLGEIVIGGPLRSNDSMKSSPGIPTDEWGNESEKERSKTPTLIHSSNPSTSSSSSNNTAASNHQDAQTRLLESYPIPPQTPSRSRSPDPDSISVADTDMQDYADLVDNDEEGGGSAVQLMTATKMSHPSPQTATLVGQSPSKTGNVAASPSQASKTSSENKSIQNRALVGMVGLGLGLANKGSPSTSNSISSPSTTVASPENAIATFSSPATGGLAQSSDRPSTGGSHGSFGTAKTSLSPSLQHHQVTPPPIGLGLGSPVTLGNGHTVTASSNGNSTEVSPAGNEALSPSTSSSSAAATPLSGTSVSSGGSSPSRRKGRPTALKLSGSSTSLNSTSSSPAAANGTFTNSRSLSSISSPKSRSNHPPPTNPPAEPLPPLPPTPSFRQNNKGPGASNNGISGGPMSPSTSSPQVHKDESPRRSSAGALDLENDLSSSSSTKAHFRSQSQGAAAALRNHAATDAATSHAQAVLKAVEQPMTFNEKNSRREIGLIAGNGTGNGNSEGGSTDIGNALIGLIGNNRDSLDSSVTKEEGTDTKNGGNSDSDEDSDGEVDEEEAEIAVLKTLTHAPVRQSMDGSRTEKSSNDSSLVSRSPGGVAVPVGRATVTRVNSKASNPQKANLTSDSSTDSDPIKPPRASLENLGNSRIVREATQRLNGSQQREGGEDSTANANGNREVDHSSSSVTVGQVPGPRRPVIHSWVQDPSSVKASNVPSSSTTTATTSNHQPTNSTSSINKFNSSDKADNRRSVIAQPGSWPASGSNTDTSQPSTPGTVSAFDHKSGGPLESALDDSSENHLTSDTIIASPLPTSSTNANANSSTGGGSSSSNNVNSNRPQMVRRRSSAASLMSNRRLEMEEDRNRAGSTQSLDPLTLKRTEGRFTGAFGETVKAFKQLQAEKRALERVVRETTPLEGLGDGEGLGRYLQSMSEKLRMSSSEISQLLDLLEQQRAVMDYMLETHELERDQLLDEIDDLRDALIQLEAASSTHRSNAEKLTEDVEKAYAEGVAARAETLKVRTLLQEEEGKRDKIMEWLNLEKKKVEELEKKHLEIQKEHEASRGQDSVDSEKTRAEVTRLESEKDYLSRSHEKSVKDLMAKHSEELKQLNSKHDKALLDHRKQVEKDAEELKANHEKDLEDFAEHVTELEDQINAHVEEKSQLFVEIESRKVQVTNINQQLQKAFAELAERGSEDSVNKSLISQDRKSLESQVASHLKEKKDLEEKIFQLNSLHQSRLNELFEEKEKHKKRHEDEKSDLQLVIDSKMQEFAGIREELANVKASHANDAEELEAIRESHEKLESEKDDLMEQLRAKDEELERASKQQQQQQVADTSSLATVSSPAALSPQDLPSADSADRSSMSSDRSDQVFTAAERKELLATLAEQRTREAQIRTAYKQLRDELRKTQAAAQQNKRNTGSFMSFGGANAPLVSPALSSASYPMSDGGHGGMPPSPGQASLLNQSSSSGGTSRQLKRLSLPLVQTKPRNGNGPVAWQDLFRPDSASSIASNPYQAPPSSYQYRSGSISSGNSLSGLGSSNLHFKNPSSSSGVEGTSSSPEPTAHGESDENMRTRLGLNDSPEEERENERDDGEGIESLTSPTLSHSSLEH